MESRRKFLAAIVSVGVPAGILNLMPGAQVRAMTDPQAKTPVDLSGVTIAEKTIVRREKGDGRLCRPHTAHSLGRSTRWESETDVELRGDRK